MQQRDIKRVGFWKRSLALAIDLVLLSITLTITTSEILPAATQNQFAIELAVYSVIAVYTSSEIWAAGTPGKRILGLRIARVDAEKADHWRLSLRWSTKSFFVIGGLLWTITSFSPFYILTGFMNLVVAIGCIAAANDDKLSWHDQWAKTAVYRKKDLLIQRMSAVT